ncbi:MAG: DUF4129 domain-containing protein [Chitinophagaceae bacterium]|nr:DUF4129 domain-containing protein [Chitinophagaceae bacterium]
MRTALVKNIICILLSFTAAVSHGQQIHEVPDSVALAMKNQEVFKYANDPSFWEKEKPTGGSAFLRLVGALLESAALRWILYFILAAVLAYLSYQVIIANNLFIASRKRRKKDNEKFGDNDVPEDVDARIAAAIAAGEYRLAVRYYYLRTLGLLNEKDKIRLHAGSTNYDYIQQMREHSYVSDFRKLTDIYEYVWYGEFQPDRKQFETISSGFNQFNGNV